VSQPPTWLQEAAATGEALAGVALFIAIWRIFVRDPRKSARKQVDELAAWAEPESELQRTPGQPHPVKIRVFLHNASTLPIEIVHVGVDVRSSWVVPDPLHHDKRVGVYKPRDGLKASSMFFRGVRLAPDQTHEQVHTLDISDHAPARSIFLWPDQGIVCEPNDPGHRQRRSTVAPTPWPKGASKAGAAQPQTRRRARTSLLVIMRVAADWPQHSYPQAMLSNTGHSTTRRGRSRSVTVAALRGGRRARCALWRTAARPWLRCRGNASG
jgi:hypothetical protein